MISDSAFFYVVPYDRNFVTTPDAPFITLLVWAESPGAALRAMDMQIESDYGSEHLHPPSELLLSPDIVTYGGIMRQARRAGITVMEHASYRAAKDGAFVHRAISVGGELEFYFRGREDDEEEKPYAIQYSDKASA